MELLEGETLAAHLNTHGPMAHGQAVDSTRQLCAGLEEAHRSGVVHRDLKSANIILCPQPSGKFRAVITDFGLARGETVAGDICGTAPYMAPEIWQGQKASKASDIYALGVILYEMIAGPRPFENEPGYERRETRPLAPSSFNHDVPSRWDRVILWCLEVAPAARPTDATQIVSALERSLVPRAPAIAIPLLLITTLFWPPFRQWVWPPPNVRLAVLSADVPEEFKTTGGGMLQDIAERIRHMRSGRRTVSVITPSEMHRHNFQ